MCTARKVMWRFISRFHAEVYADAHVEVHVQRLQGKSACVLIHSFIRSLCGAFGGQVRAWTEGARQNSSCLKGVPRIARPIVYVRAEITSNLTSQFCAGKMTSNTARPRANFLANHATNRATNCHTERCTRVATHLRADGLARLATERCTGHRTNGIAEAFAVCDIVGSEHRAAGPTTSCELRTSRRCTRASQRWGRDGISRAVRDNGMVGGRAPH
mmetsp:Transcript_9361/g.19156  ORF Transcript_9361/g.19156 Transcript_9361/m.19156 type:complete len:216 (-) Transcript_9361:3-650(-)